MGSFVIPEGATTGTRIEFDAELGRIRIYNASNQLEAEIVPGGVITVYDTSQSPSPYVQLEGSNLWVVSGDETHYFRAVSGPASATMQVVDDQQSSCSASIASTGVPFFRLEHRVGGVSVNLLQMDVNQTQADLEYTNDGGTTVIQRFLENVGIMWSKLTAATAQRNILFDQAAGFLKSGTYNVTTDARTTENWNNLALNAGWTADQPCQYKLFPDGTVRLRGIGNFNVSPVPGGTNLATLPVGYRPTQYTLIPNAYDSSATKGRIEIQTTGVISIYDAPNDLPCLDSVSFSTI
jgi:hypothetical protein